MKIGLMLAPFKAQKAQKAQWANLEYSLLNPLPQIQHLLTVTMGIFGLFIANEF
jgi:hypothetical protein